MPIAAIDLSFVRELVRARSGIALGPESDYLVEARLAPLARELGLRSLAALVQRLREGRTGPLHERVVEAMTTNETSFFRDRHPFETLREVVLPELIRKRAAARRLSLWCAAASSGQEPYSVAMLLRDHFPELRGWKLDFLATDLSSEMLARCRAGLFNDLEIERGLPAALKARHFEARGGTWQIAAELRRMIDFKPLNLSGAWPKLPRFDLVLMRNVLIYFDHATRQEILARTRAQLAPDGVLFLGATETSLELDGAFEPLRVGRSVCFRLRDPARKPERGGRGPAPLAAPAARASRASPRFAFPRFASFRSGQGPGRGILVDVSESGARLEHPDPLPALGARLTLAFLPVEGEPPIEVEASVARRTPGGIGLRFTPGTPAQLRIAEGVVWWTADGARR